MFSSSDTHINNFRVPPDSSLCFQVWIRRRVHQRLAVRSCFHSRAFTNRPVQMQEKGVVLRKHAISVARSYMPCLRSPTSGEFVKRSVCVCHLCLSGARRQGQGLGRFVERSVPGNEPTGTGKDGQGQAHGAHQLRRGGEAG